MSNGWVDLPAQEKTSIVDYTTGDQLKVNPDGSINVDSTIIPGPVGSGVNVYNEVTGVAMFASQVIVTYTVPAGKTLALVRVDASSDSLSIIDVEIDSVVNSKKRIYYTDFNTDFDFSSSNGGLILAAGSVINIIGTNESPNGAASFNANIQGILT